MLKYLHLILIIPAVLLLLGSFSVEAAMGATAGSIVRYTGYGLMIVAVYLSFRQKQR